MTRSRKGVTAAEFKAELERDPIWVEQRRQREEAFKRLEEEYARAEAPLVRELRAAGLTVGSAWDLVNTTSAYRQALPILLDHLHREYPDAIREGIARALAVPEAKFAWPVLVKLYREEQGPRTKDGLAVAICNIADDTVIGELIALVRDNRNGESKVLLLRALERSRDPRAHKALMELGTNADLKNETQIILKRILRRRKRAKK